MGFRLRQHDQRRQWALSGQAGFRLRQHNQRRHWALSRQAGFRLRQEGQRRQWALPRQAGFRLRQHNQRRQWALSRQAGFRLRPHDHMFYHRSHDLQKTVGFVETSRLQIEAARPEILTQKKRKMTPDECPLVWQGDWTEFLFPVMMGKWMSDTDLSASEHALIMYFGRMYSRKCRYFPGCFCKSKLYS